MSEINIMDFDPSSSIKSYNFTNTAIRRFYDTIDSEQFKDEKKEKIFEYLTGEMEIVPFNDQLKRYLYEKNENTDAAQLSFDNMTTGENVTWVKRCAITDAILSRFKGLYGERVTKEDIFYYIYAVLQCKQYNELYRENLVKEMPRIPMLAHFPDYVRIGRELADLHLNYEKPVSADRKSVV